MSRTGHGGAATPIPMLLISSVLAISAVVCRSAPTVSQPRLVLLYATCTVAKNSLSPYAPSVPDTKAIAAFAERGLVFRRHQTEAGQSGIAFASIFTGGQAPHHQVFRHPSKLLDETVVIGEVFQAAGYDTYAWLNHGMAQASLNYAQGVAPAHSTKDILTADAPRFAELLEKLKADASYKAFVVTNFSVTHQPYKGALVDEYCAAYPSECSAIHDPGDIAWVREIFDRNQDSLAFDFDNAVKRLALDQRQVERLIALAPILYKADIFLLDRMFGAVVAKIEEAGLLDESLIAFTSDHGEVLYRDNALFHWTHGYELAAEDVEAPLVVVGASAGVPRGEYTGVTRSIDVLPTLAGLAGIASPEFEGRGVDLTQAIRGNEPEPKLRAFSHTTLFNAPLRAATLALRASLFPAPLPEYMWVSVRDEDLSMTRTRSADDVWTTRVYDLAADPHQKDDLFHADDPRHRELETALESYRQALIVAAYDQETDGQLPRAQVVERLKALGYTQ